MLTVHKDEKEIRDATGDNWEINKRVYVPGVTLKSACPKCGKEWTLNLGHDYVAQYPVSGRPIAVHALCESKDCVSEWMAGRVAYVLTVEIVK